MGTVALGNGGDPRCAECGVSAAGRMTVAQSEEGWCVVTLCGCESPFFTRESAFYASPQEAWQALDEGSYEPE